MGRVRELSPAYHTQFVVDNNGKRVGFVLDIKAYRELIEAHEELEDIKAFDKSYEKSRSEIQKGKYLTIEELRKNMAKIRHRKESYK